MCTINPTFSTSINPSFSPTTTMNPVFNNTSSIPSQHGQATLQHVIIDIDPSTSEIMTIGGVHFKVRINFFKYKFVRENIIEAKFFLQVIIHLFMSI
jgi:hypothetical protein